MSEQKRIEHGMENVFGIENGETSFCHVAYFQWDHPYLRVSVQNKDGKGDMYFSNPTHFEGDLAWVGANFRTASKEERDDFIEKINRKVDLYTEQTFLYMVDTQYPDRRPYTHKILAYRASYYPQSRFYKASSYEDLLLERVKLHPKTGDPYLTKTEVIATSQGSKERTYPTPLRIILERFEAGDSHADILALIPWLEPEDIQAALIYARRAITKPSNTE